MSKCESTKISDLNPVEDVSVEAISAVVQNNETFKVKKKDEYISSISSDSENALEIGTDEKLHVKKSPTTTQGDLITHDGVSDVRLPIGSETYVLTVENGGLVYKTISKLTTKGDLLTHDGVSETRILIGLEGQVLTVEDGMLLYKNSQAIIPVGFGVLLASEDIPDGYLNYDGSFVGTITFADLYAIIGNVWGNSYSNGFLSLGISSDWKAIIFNDDGSKMIVIEDQASVSYAYNLSVPFEQTTAISSGESFDSGSNGSSSISFNDDGSVYYAFDTQGTDTLRQYPLSSSYNLNTTGTSNGAYAPIAGGGESYSGFTFHPDGSKLFFVSNFGIVDMHNLSTPFDVNTASDSGDQFNFRDIIGLESILTTKIRFSNDGSKVFILDRGNNFVYSFDMSTNYDITTIVYNNDFFNASLVDIQSSWGFTLNNDGSKLYLIVENSQGVYDISMPINYSLNSIEELFGLPEIDTHFSSSLPDSTLNFVVKY